VCRGVVSRDVHTLRHITPRWGWSPGEQTERGNGGGLPGSHQEVSLELALLVVASPFRSAGVYSTIGSSPPRVAEKVPTTWRSSGTTAAL